MSEEWVDINLEVPPVHQDLYMVKDINDPNELPCGRVAMCMKGGGEVWFIKEGKEIKVTHWLKVL